MTCILYNSYCRAVGKLTIWKSVSSKTNLIKLLFGGSQTLLFWKDGRFTPAGHSSQCISFTPITNTMSSFNCGVSLYKFTIQQANESKMIMKYASLSVLKDKPIWVSNCWCFPLSLDDKTFSWSGHPSYMLQQINTMWVINKSKQPLTQHIQMKSRILILLIYFWDVWVGLTEWNAHRNRAGIKIIKYPVLV